MLRQDFCRDRAPHALFTVERPDDVVRRLDRKAFAAHAQDIAPLHFYAPHKESGKRKIGGEAAEKPGVFRLTDDGDLQRAVAHACAFIDRKTCDRAPVEHQDEHGGRPNALLAACDGEREHAEGVHQLQGVAEFAESEIVRNHVPTPNSVSTFPHDACNHLRGSIADHQRRRHRPYSHPPILLRQCLKSAAVGPAHIQRKQRLFGDLLRAAAAAARLEQGRGRLRFLRAGARLRASSRAMTRSAGGGGGFRGRFARLGGRFIARWEGEERAT